MPSSARIRRVGRSTAVSGSQMPGGAAPEPELEVAQAPADLGPAVGEGSERQDGVVVGLGHGVAGIAAVDVRRVRSESTKPSWVEASWSCSQLASVGPRSYEMWRRLPRSALGL